MMHTKRIFLSLAMVVLLLVAVTPGTAQQTYHPVGTISIDMTSVAVGIGFSSGSGVLRYNGQRYLFKIDGLSVGAVGIASISAVGNAYNLSDVSQFAGSYAAAGAGIALAGGRAGLTLQNQSGVIIDLYAVQQGVELNIGPQGFKITMK